MLDAILAFLLALRWPVTDDGCPIIPLPLPHETVYTPEPCDSSCPCVNDADDWRKKLDQDRMMPPVLKLEWPRPKDEVIQINLPSLTPVEPTVLVYRTFIIFNAAGQRLGTTEGLITISLRSWVALHGALTEQETEDLKHNRNVLLDFFNVCTDPI